MSTDDQSTGDKPSQDELQRRVAELEETVAKLLPNRRDVLKMGVGGAVGALAYGSATGGTAAQSSSAEVGQIGEDSRRVDLYGDDVLATNIYGDSLAADSDSSVTLGSAVDANGNNLTGVGSLDTDDVDIGSATGSLDRDSPLFVRANTGQGLILQPDDTSGTTAEERANILWYNTESPPEKEAVITGDNGSVSAYVKPNAQGAGNAGLEKVLDMSHHNGEEGPKRINMPESNVLRFRDDGSILTYNSLSDAISDSVAGDRLHLNGVATANATGQTINKSLTIIGPGIGEQILDGGANPAFDIQASGVTIRDFQLQSDGTGSAPAVRIDNTSVTLENLRLRNAGAQHIVFTANSGFATAENLVRINGASGSESILFELGSDSNTLLNYRNAGPITDNDGSNATSLIN